MSEGYRKIFWGIFIATFNIKLGIVKILPAFVGFIIISSGINILIEETKLESFKKGKLYSNILAFVLFFGGLPALLGANLESNIFYQLIPVVYLTLELLLFYKVFEGSIEKLYIENPEFAKDYESKLNFYIIASIINNVLLCIVLVFNFENILTAFTGIVVLVLRIFLMTSMSRLKKLFLNDENPEVN